MILLLLVTVSVCQEVLYTYDCELGVANPLTSYACDRSPICDCTPCYNVSNPAIVWCAPYFSLNTSHLPSNTAWNCTPVTKQYELDCRASLSAPLTVLGYIVVVILVLGIFYLIGQKLCECSNKRSDYSQF